MPEKKLERVAGIEPALEAWEASAVPGFSQKSELSALASSGSRHGPTNEIAGFYRGFTAPELAAFLRVDAITFASPPCCACSTGEKLRAHVAGREAR